MDSVGREELGEVTKESGRKSWKIVEVKDRFNDKEQKKIKNYSKGTLFDLRKMQKSGSGVAEVENHRKWKE
jgi:hypothetical protein